MKRSIDPRLLADDGDEPVVDMQDDGSGGDLCACGHPRAAHDDEGAGRCHCLRCARFREATG